MTALSPAGRSRWPAEREVLQRQPQRLGVRELALEQVQARLERGQLGVVQVQRRQEVVLALQRVELLAGELVALRRDADAEREQLGPVRVEAPGECLVRHLRVALDRVLRVARRDRPALGHQVRDERELPNQLVAVMTQASRIPPPEDLRTGAPGAGASAMARVVAHLDLDAFFAAVEVLERPSSRACRWWSAGPRRPGRGVDRELRGAGVRHPLGDVGAEARRRCPDAVFVRPSMARYSAWSRGSGRW